MIQKETINFWKSLSVAEKNEFLLLSMAFRKCVEKNSKAFSGKFVEVPILKKKYNSNIFVYKSPWNEDCLSFEFMSHFDLKTNSVKKFLFPSNGATIRNFNELVDSWNEFVSNYKIMEF